MFSIESSQECVDLVLVEDNPNDAELTIHVLGKKKLSKCVYWATDGIKAKNYLNDLLKSKDLSKLPKLVLLDIKLPGISGFDLLQQLRSEPVFRQVPMVIFSSSEEEDDIALAYKLGANAYVCKPIEFNEFERTLFSVCEFWLSVNKTVRNFR